MFGTRAPDIHFRICQISYQQQHDNKTPQFHYFVVISDIIRVLKQFPGYIIRPFRELRVKSFLFGSESIGIQSNRNFHLNRAKNMRDACSCEKSFNGLSTTIVSFFFCSLLHRLFLIFKDTEMYKIEKAMLS